MTKDKWVIKDIKFTGKGHVPLHINQPVNVPAQKIGRADGSYDPRSARKFQHAKAKFIKQV